MKKIEHLRSKPDYHHQNNFLSVKKGIKYINLRKEKSIHYGYLVFCSLFSPALKKKSPPQSHLRKVIKGK